MTLHQYLQDRTRAAYRELIRSLDGLAPEEAAAGAAPGWRRYRYGTGLDGSVRGIVRHVAAWKASGAEGLETGAFPPADSALPEDLAWEPLLQRLAGDHARLAASLAALDEPDLTRVVQWEGEEMSLCTVFTVLLEHDQYHAGQVNLLRQQRGHALRDG